MSLKNFICIFFMIFNSLFSIFLYNFYNYDFIFSLSLVLNLIISFYVLIKNSPENYFLKLSIVYLMGFSLFICGRYIYGLFGDWDIYCFDFGYNYCLNESERIKTNFLINFSLVFFVFGFLFNSKKIGKFLQKKEEAYINYKVLVFITVICFLTGFINLYFQLEAVLKAISGGYITLYEGQTEAYETPFSLIVSTIFLATLSIVYSVNKKIKPIYFYALIFIFIFGQSLGILTGARASFITALVVLVWIFLGSEKVNLKKIILILSILAIIPFVNYLASISGARVVSSGGSISDKILTEVFYSQGISMMVFSLSTLETSYPLLAYLKVIFPGIQVIYSFFGELNQYDLSFSQSLTYRLAPSVYYDNMGWGWSLLSDFYAFSFGFSALFLLYNFMWGKLIFRISLYNNKNIYYRGLFFCFLVLVFSISRSSVSYLIFLVILYTILYWSLKFKIGKN